MHGARAGGAEGGTRRYDAVLLDMFGTLVDFRTTFNATLQRILTDLGLEGQARVFQRNWRTFTFQGDDEGGFITVHEDFKRGLESTLRSLGVGGELRPYCDDVIDELFERLRAADLYPEVRGVIEGLEGAGVAWAVVSNIDEDDLRTILARRGLRPLAAVSSEAARSYKPDAGPFMAALASTGVGAARALHVGDSPLADVDGAQRHGISAAWLNRYNDPYPPGLLEPAHTMHDLRPLLSIVDGRE